MGAWELLHSPWEAISPTTGKLQACAFARVRCRVAEQAQTQSVFNRCSRGAPPLSFFESKVFPVYRPPGLSGFVVRLQVVQIAGIILVQFSLTFLVHFWLHSLSIFDFIWNRKLTSKKKVFGPPPAKQNFLQNEKIFFSGKLFY